MENKRIESHHDLVVWQMSHQLTLQIYRICPKLRKDEGEHLANFLRTAAPQIPINIALGFKKRGKTAKIHYYRTALTALEELSYYVALSIELGQLKDAEEITGLIENLEKKIKGLLRSLAGSH